jgi:hypothetical protein
LPAGTTLHRIPVSQLLEQVVGTQLLEKQSFLCLILFTAYHSSIGVFFTANHSSRVTVFFSLLITALVIGSCIHCLIAVAFLAESLVFLFSLELIVLN